MKPIRFSIRILPFLTQFSDDLKVIGNFVLVKGFRSVNSGKNPPSMQET